MLAIRVRGLLRPYNCNRRRGSAGARGRQNGAARSLLEAAHKKRGLAHARSRLLKRRRRRCLRLSRSGGVCGHGGRLAAARISARFRRVRPPVLRSAPQQPAAEAEAAATLASTSNPAPPPGLPLNTSGGIPVNGSTNHAIPSLNLLVHLLQQQQQQHQQAVAAAAAAQQQAAVHSAAQNGVNGGWQAGDVGAALRGLSGLLPAQIPTAGPTEPSNGFTVKACEECSQLRREFQELRQQVLSWVWLGKTLQAQETSATISHLPQALNGDALTLASMPGVISHHHQHHQQQQQQQHQQQQHQNLARKRPASNQPDAPVALRPMPSCDSLPTSCFNSMSWQLLAPPEREVPSPTLPAPEHVEQPGKWSSPSSVESHDHKTDSSTGESNQIDPVGIDASEVSSTSSTSTQAMLQSPERQHNAQPQEPTPPAPIIAPQPTFSFVPKDITSFNLLFNNDPAKSSFYQLPKNAIPVAATLPTQGSTCERRARKQISDDFVKLIQQYENSGSNGAETDIPVPEAVRCDPQFRAVSEQQIITQITQSKRFDEMDLAECMSNLCKKLAEKRVFGSKLMSQTTVAGPNHSNYNNLPIAGIVYIKDVCRKVFGEKVSSDAEFWDHFRNAMRKLAARCRRVRHAKKTKSIRDEAVQLATSRGSVDGNAPSPNPFALAVAVSTALGNTLQTLKKDDDKKEAAETLASLNSSLGSSGLSLNLLQSLASGQASDSDLGRLFPLLKVEEPAPLSIA